MAIRKKKSDFKPCGTGVSVDPFIVILPQESSNGE